MRHTHKYQFNVGNLRVYCGITNDLSHREHEHQNSCRYTNHNGKLYYCNNGHIGQVGNITTYETAIRWEREKNCNANWL